MPGFEVVSDALIDASVGVTGTVADLRSAPIAALDPGAAAGGQSDMANAVTDFCRRWQRGVTSLIDDSDQFANRLRQAADAYLGIDTLLADELRNDTPPADTS